MLLVELPAAGLSLRVPLEASYYCLVLKVATVVWVFFFSGLVLHSPLSAATKHLHHRVSFHELIPLSAVLYCCSVLYVTLMVCVVCACVSLSFSGLMSVFGRSCAPQPRAEVLSVSLPLLPVSVVLCLLSTVCLSSSFLPLY